MTLLDFARGPALQWSIAIMIAGILWRLISVLILSRPADLSAPRDAFANFKAYRTVFSRAWPHTEYMVVTRYQTTLAYIFHIATLIVVVGIAPHIDFIKGLTGLSWPSLPNSVGIFFGALAFFSLVALVLRRLAQRQVYCSTLADHLTWIVVGLPLLTGLMAFAHVGFRYETLLALHILSVALLFIWFPFSKLMHAFWFIFSRAQNGAFYASKGVRV